MMGKRRMGLIIYILLGLTMIAVSASAQTFFQGRVDPTNMGIPYEGGLVIKSYYGGTKTIVAAELEPCTPDNDLGVGCVSTSGNFSVNIDRNFLPDAWYFITGVGAKSYAYGYVYVSSGVPSPPFVNVSTYPAQIYTEEAKLSFWQTLPDGRRLVRLEMVLANQPSYYGDSETKFNIYVHMRAPIFIGNDAPVSDNKYTSSLPSSGGEKTLMVYTYMSAYATFFLDNRLCATIEIQNQFGFGLLSTREVCAYVPPRLDKRRIADVQSIVNAVESYYLVYSRYPTEISPLTVGAYLDPIPVDPLTGSPYSYAYDSTFPSHYQVWTELETHNSALYEDSDINSSGWVGGLGIDASSSASEECASTSVDCVYDLGR